MNGTETLPKLGVGWVVSTTLAVSRHNLAALLLLGILFDGLPSLLPLWPGLARHVNAGFNDARVVPFLNGIVTGIMQGLLTASATHVVLADWNGRRAGFGASLGVGLRCILPVIGVVFVASIGIGIGLILLVVPGVIMYLNWLVAVPARVAEGPGIQRAMSRSAALVRGSRWRCLALVILIVFVPTLGLLAVEAVLGAFGYGEGSLPTTAADFVFKAILAVLDSVMIAVVFVQLRHLKEGPDRGSVADVFG